MEKSMTNPRRKRPRLNTKQWLDEHNRLRLRVLKVVLAKEKRYTKKSWLISNLYEAYCSYEHMFEHILDNPKWNLDKLGVEFHEIYWHTNMAYNSRNVAMRQIHKALMKDKAICYKWLNHPKDIVFERPKQKRKP